MQPWNIIQEDQTYELGKTQTYYRLLGVAQLDYLQLYRKFTIKNQESYRLDHIGKVELGEQKDDNPFDTFKECLNFHFQKVNHVFRFILRSDESALNSRGTMIGGTIAFE